MISNNISKSNASIGQTINSSPTTSVTANSSTSSNSTYGLEKGQIVRGEVIDLRSNEVSIKLEDGRLLSGKLEDSTNLSIGDKVSFRVEEVSLKNLTLKIIAESYNSLQDITIDKALEAAILGKSSRNREIVKELMNQQMSIDKRTISYFIQQSILNKECSIQSLVLMNKYNIPITEANVSQFEAYRKGEHSMLNEIVNLTNSLPDLFSQLSSNPYPESISLTTKLLTIILNNSTGQVNTISNNEFEQHSLDVQNNINNTNSINNTDTINTMITTNPNAVIKETAPNSIQDFVNSHKDNAAFNSDVNPQLATTVEPLSTNQNIESPYQNLPYNKDQIGSYLTNADRANLLQSLETFSLPSVITDRITTGAITTQELLNIVKDNLSTIPEETSKYLFSSKEFKALIKNELLDKWTFTPDSFTKEGEIDKHFLNLYHQLNEIKDYIAQTMNTNESVSGQANHLQENIDFMKTLNELFTYMQLPLKLQNQHTNSELYVYTKKKEGRTAEDGISVLLHLDMDHLGPIDIHIDLHHNNIVSKFYFNDEDTIQLVSSHMKDLEHALKQKGYVLNAEVLKRAKDIDIVEDFIKKDSPTPTVTRYNFDIRA